MVSVGVLLPTREAFLQGSHDAGPLLEFGRAAEAAGFDSVWAGDSLVARPRLEPLTLLAAVAAVTRTVSIGTAALTGALRQPLLAAHAIATLDQVAAGRTILGLGTGFPYPETEAEFKAAGARFDQRVGRLTEAVELWRALWDPARDPDAPLAFAGKYRSFEGIERLPLPARPGGPPLWLAGGSDAAVTRAGRLFDGWLPYSPTPEEYAHGYEKLLAAASAAGRDAGSLTPAFYATVNLHDDEGRARAELAVYVQRYYDVPLEIMETLQPFYSGPAEGCFEWLNAFVEAGARHLVLRFGARDAGAQLDRAAGGILPALAA